MYLSSVSSRLLLYDTNTWELKKSYGCYDGILRDISWSNDGKYLLQVNSKGLVEVLTATDHDVRSLQHVPLKDTWSASFHRDGHRNVAIGTKSGNVMIWDTKNKTITKTFPTPSQQSSVNHISFNAKNTSLAATMNNGDTIIYGLVSNIPVLTVKLPCSKSISAMKFHHESRSLLGLATDEGHLVLRDITTNKDRVMFEGVHAAPIGDFTYSLVNKDVMLSCGFDKVMHVYDVRLQNVVSSIKTSYTLTSLAINEDNFVCLSTKTGPLLLYDLRDLTKPWRVLKGHDEEVRKVCFQPIRRKPCSTDVSLREESGEVQTPHVMVSPPHNRTSDMFYMADTPPNNNQNTLEQREVTDDSFLVMMGLDSSTNEDSNKSIAERKIDNLESSHRPVGGQTTEKNVSRFSTPLNSKIAENVPFHSPTCVMDGIPDDGRSNHIKSEAMHSPNNNCMPSSESIDRKVMEEMKDFIKLTLADIADDNRNYFLHIMMALTKQKLLLEKQLAGMNEQIKNLIENQNSLVEMNRKLALEIDQLKSQKKYFKT